MTAADRNLDEAVVRFVDRVMADDRAGAVHALGDAQSYDLAAVGAAAHVWVAVELVAARSLPDTVGASRSHVLLVRARQRLAEHAAGSPSP